MTDESRRQFLRTAAVGTGVVGLALAGWWPTRGAPKRLRPPGALDERDLLAACIKCGQCVQVCPVEALKPADLTDGFGVGVPFIDPRAQACDFSCDVLQCVLACPTGALAYHKPAFLSVREGAAMAAPPVLLAKQQDPEPTLQLAERMGVAKLVRPEACLSALGQGVHGPTRGAGFDGLKRWSDVDRWKPAKVREHDYQLEVCDLCVRECPVQGAISLEAQVGADGVTRHLPVVHEACVGCGVCEMMCPAEGPAIVVTPRETWRGA